MSLEPARSVRFADAGRAAVGRPVLVVQHQDTCPPALFARWLSGAGVSLDVRRPYRGDPLPTGLDDHTGLLVLGGSMGAHDDADHPWLVPTKDLLRHAVATDRPTLAICLGHQLAAVALGGTSRPNPRGQSVGVRSIGWRADPAADPLFQALAGHDTLVPHWNSDVVSRLPGHVTVLATTDDGAPQVVRLGERAWAVQFHPEADHALVSVWADEDREQAARRGLDVDEALQQLKEHQPHLHATGRRIAEGLADIVQGAR